MAASVWLSRRKQLAAALRGLIGTRQATSLVRAFWAVRLLRKRAVRRQGCAQNAGSLGSQPRFVNEGEEGSSCQRVRKHRDQAEGEGKADEKR